MGARAIDVPKPPGGIIPGELRLTSHTYALDETRSSVFLVGQLTPTKGNVDWISDLPIGGASDVGVTSNDRILVDACDGRPELRACLTRIFP
jgi:hypothetical protein